MDPCNPYTPSSEQPPSKNDSRSNSRLILALLIALNLATFATLLWSFSLKAPAKEILLLTVGALIPGLGMLIVLIAQHQKSKRLREDEIKDN